MRESRSKIRAVDATVSRRLGRVEVFASRAVQFDGLLVRNVGQTTRKKWLRLAEHARAPAKVRFFVLLQLGVTRVSESGAIAEAKL